MDRDLRGKHARVTGSTAGMGWAMARALAAQGAALSRLLLIAAISTACAGGIADDPSQHAAPEQPIDGPDLRGIITARAGETIRVEEVPGQGTGSAKAVVGLTPLTWIETVRGERLSMDALLVGQRVGVWFTAPVDESYPFQGEGLRIVVE